MDNFNPNNQRLEFLFDVNNVIQQHFIILKELEVSLATMAHNNETRKNLKEQIDYHRDQIQGYCQMTIVDKG